MRLRDIHEMGDLRDMGGSDVGFVVGVALGTVVGAAVALLMTPLPGREARQRLAQRAEEMREHMPEIRHGSNGQEPYPAEAATPADAPTRIGGPAV